MTSPMLMLSTSASNTKAPASFMVLKKIGATLPPIQIPPARLLGVPGISSPINHNTELVADLRDEPVPTTSPTNATGWPFFLSSSICSAALVIPSRGILYMALACNGMSGRDHASGAGDRSSVLVSPVTLNTVAVISLASSGRLVNHSAAAHDSITALATALPLFIFSSTSWKASNINKVCFSSSPANSASSALSSNSTKVTML
ncbi:MAG: Uncharacterised protein [Pseudidiomarina mangrovi]|nr:MAG: Uncharacterised protein [Pseudidiomarina mangrovi]